MARLAVAIAYALHISAGELAGMPEHRVNLSGDWWAAWQTFKDGEEISCGKQGGSGSVLENAVGGHDVT